MNMKTNIQGVVVTITLNDFRNNEEVKKAISVLNSMCNTPVDKTRPAKYEVRIFTNNPENYYVVGIFEHDEAHRVAHALKDVSKGKLSYKIVDYEPSN